MPEQSHVNTSTCSHQHACPQPSLDDQLVEACGSRSVFTHPSASSRPQCRNHNSAHYIHSTYPRPPHKSRKIALPPCFSDLFGSVREPHRIVLCPIISQKRVIYPFGFPERENRSLRCASTRWPHHRKSHTIKLGVFSSLRAATGPTCFASHRTTFARRRQRRRRRYVQFSGDYDDDEAFGFARQQGHHHPTATTTVITAQTATNTSQIDITQSCVGYSFSRVCVFMCLFECLRS